VVESSNKNSCGRAKNVITTIRKFLDRLIFLEQVIGFKNLAE
jgi:ribosomal protein L31E